MGNPERSVSRNSRAYSASDIERWKFLKRGTAQSGPLSWDQVSEITGISSGAMRVAVVRYEKKIQSGIQNEDKRSSERIEELVLRGLSVPEMAQELGVAQNTVYTHLNNLGIDAAERQKYKRINAYRRETVELTKIRMAQ